jgi:sporulation protein YlmC with PRC-barrel domain
MFNIRDGEAFLVKWHRREEVVGKEIVDGDARKVGVVKDLAWSNGGKLAVVVERGKEEEAYLAFEQVEKIGDVVFIKSASSLESVPMKTCPVCKHKNLVDAKFCQRCGKTLEEKK